MGQRRVRSPDHGSDCPFTSLSGGEIGQQWLTLRSDFSVAGFAEQFSKTVGAGIFLKHVGEHLSQGGRRAGIRMRGLASNERS